MYRIWFLLTTFLCLENYVSNNKSKIQEIPHKEHLAWRKYNLKQLRSTRAAMQVAPASSELSTSSSTHWATLVMATPVRSRAWTAVGNNSRLIFHWTHICSNRNQEHFEKIMFLLDSVHGIRQSLGICIWWQWKCEGRIFLCNVSTNERMKILCNRLTTCTLHVHDIRLVRNNTGTKVSSQKYEFHHPLTCNIDTRTS